MVTDVDGGVDGEKLLLAAEAASRLGVTIPMLSRWEEQGILCPAFRLGSWGLRVFNLGDVERLRRERKRRTAVGEIRRGRRPAQVLEVAR